MSVVLKDFIEAEGLEPGDRLPPERDLALKLGLPRTALRTNACFPGKGGPRLSGMWAGGHLSLAAA